MRNRMTFGIAAFLLTAALVGCSGQAAAPASAGGKAAAGAPPAQKDFEDFDAGSFTHPTVIDHHWYPFAAGTQYVYRGSTVEDGQVIPHRVVVTVTDLTKVIDGVTARVNYILDYSGDQVVEAELAFFAQDDSGAVWRMGEHPEEYEDGVFVTAPTWIAGIQGAHAGIAMLAEPQLGAPSYSQGWGPGVDFTDRGQVVETGMQVCTPLDCFDDVIVIRENSRAEPDAFQYKYYAPGMYNIRVDWRGLDEAQEVLELVAVTHLSSAELAQIRATVLALEAHANQVSPGVYAQTPPMAPAAE